MNDKVRVPKGDKASTTAILLLAAAEETEGFEAEDVVVSSYGGFLVPVEIAKAAGLDYEDEGNAMGHVYTSEEVDNAGPLETPTGTYEPDEPADEKPVAKKAPAKKTAAKKAPAKKAAAKKTTAKKAGN